MLQHFSQLHPVLAIGVVLSTAATDAVYVFFTYTRDWSYVVFAALGSWIGAYLSMSFLHAPPRNAPAPVAPPME